MIEQLFSKYGNVKYISLPRYEDRLFSVFYFINYIIFRSFKGFGFVEYETEEQAQLALNKLNEYDLGNGIILFFIII